MQRGATVFLRAVLVLIGVGALAFLLWEPHLEGINADATLFEIYFKDPFLAYAYVGSTPFFIGLYQAFRLLRLARRNEEFSASAVRSVRLVRRCALALIGFVIVGLILIFLGPEDDRAGAVFIGGLVISASILVAASMAVLERTLKSGAELRSRLAPEGPTVSHTDSSSGD